MTTPDLGSADSVFADRDWEFVHSLRSTVQAGDVARFGALVSAMNRRQSEVLGFIVPTLIGVHTAVPAPERALRLTARVLAHHAVRFIAPAPLSVDELVEFMGAMLHQSRLPDVEVFALMAFLVGFLMPDGVAERSLRERFEPVWAHAVAQQAGTRGSLDRTEPHDDLS